MQTYKIGIGVLMVVAGVFGAYRGNMLGGLIFALFGVMLAVSEASTTSKY